jgi:hypothetical protein
MWRARRQGKPLGIFVGIRPRHAAIRSVASSRGACSIRCRSFRGSAKLYKGVDSGEQQHGRRKKPGCRARNMDAGDRSPEDSGQGVATSVGDTKHDCAEVDERPHPGGIAKCKRRECRENQDSYREVNEKFLKCEIGHGPVAKPLAKSSYGRVVDRKEAMDGFIRYMEGQCAPDEDPGHSETP